MAATPLVYARFKAPEAANGTLDVYEAGSLQNRKTTYSDPDLTSANANPVVLNSLGEADVFYSGLAQLVLKDSDESTIWTKDDIGLSGDTSTQYVNSLSATYGSSTTFTLSGDQTTEYHVNRIVRLTGSSTAYGRITASSYSNPTTTVTVVLTSGTLDATLATAATSLLAANSTSGAPFSHVQGSDVASASTLVLNTLVGDYCFITGTTAITAVTLTKGRHVFCKAGGAFTITHGASLICPGAANIAATSGDTFTLIGEASGVVRVSDYSFNSVQIGNLGLSGYITGFVPTTSADADHDLTFSTGCCRNASDTITCKPTWTTLIKQIDAAWAEGTNAGGMATGSVAADTVYYYNLIRKNSDTTVFDIVIDVSSSNANTPTGWTFMREVYRARTNSSSNLVAATYRQLNGGAIQVVPSGDYTVAVDAASNPGTSLVTFTAGGSVATMTPPPSCHVGFVFKIVDASPASITYGILRETAQTDSTPSATNFHVGAHNETGITTTTGVAQVEAFIDASRQATYKLSQSTADHSVWIVMNNWVITRI